MDDQAALLQGIIENPRDMLRRLVYADYLEETGDPDRVARAHLIRTQIALDDTTLDADEYERLKAFESRLLDLFRETWDLELPLWVVETGEAEYRRGFVEHVTVRIERLAELSGELFRTLPIRSLALECVSRGLTWVPELAGLLDRTPQLRQIEALRLDSSVPFVEGYTNSATGRFETETVFRDLMACRTLIDLRSLDVSKSRITDQWLVAFVSALPEAAFAGTLEVLNLSDCYHITDAGGNTLATARALENLTRLVLKDVRFSGDTRRMLRRRFGDRVTF